ncbi:MAG: hypothetical protein U0795_04565 [Pirellulales bacterium]
MTGVCRQSPHQCLLIALLAICGCQPASSPKGVPTYPVTGSLTINGQPAGGAWIKLYRADRPGRMPTAIVRDDGSFAFGFYGVDDGAPAGTYSVLVVWMMIPSEGGLAIDRLGLRFTDPNRPVAQVVVKPGENTLLPIRLKANLAGNT